MENNLSDDEHYCNAISKQCFQWKTISMLMSTIAMQSVNNASARLIRITSRFIQLVHNFNSFLVVQYGFAVFFFQLAIKICEQPYFEKGGSV